MKAGIWSRQFFMVGVLVVGWAPMAASVVLIDEDFDNDPTGGLYEPPTNLNAPGTWLPNLYTTNNVPDWEAGDDAALQMRARNGLGHDHGSGATRGGEFTNVGRLGEFNLDGFIKADADAVTGQVVHATVRIDNGDGEQKFGLSSDIQAMADSTATMWGPAPASAMVVELVYGQGFSGRFLQAIDHLGRIIALNPVPGPLFPDGAGMGDYLKFDIDYTVGAGTIAVTLNDTMNLTVQTGFETWGYNEGDPPPLRNLAPQTQVDGIFFAGTRGGTWYSIDDILLETVVPTVEYTEVTVGDVAVLDFESTAGAVYSLEYAMEPDTNDWMVTGATLTGNGEILTMYDPAGHSTQKVYRITLQTP